MTGDQPDAVGEPWGWLRGLSKMVAAVSEWRELNPEDKVCPSPAREEDRCWPEPTVNILIGTREFLRDWVTTYTQGSDI